MQKRGQNLETFRKTLIYLILLFHFQDVKLFYAEEEEVEHRNPQKDLNLFKSTTNEVRKCFKDVRDAKDKPDKFTVS